MIPVTVVEKIASTSPGCRPASSRAADSASQPSSTACSMNRSLAAPKSVSPGYASIGNTRLRCETLAERCRLRRIS